VVQNATIGKVFDVSHVVVPSTISSELRFLAIGVIQNRFVTVVYTIRGKAIRIISFRRSHHEGVTNPDLNIFSIERFGGI
jgi:uncharacterized DUF497 family protein